MNAFEALSSIEKEEHHPEEELTEDGKREVIQKWGDGLMADWLRRKSLDEHMIYADALAAYKPWLHELIFEDERGKDLIDLYHTDPEAALKELDTLHADQTLQ